VPPSGHGPTPNRPAPAYGSGAYPTFAEPRPPYPEQRPHPAEQRPPFGDPRAYPGQTSPAPAGPASAGPFDPGRNAGPLAPGSHPGGFGPGPGRRRHPAENFPGSADDTYGGPVNSRHGFDPVSDTHAGSRRGFDPVSDTYAGPRDAFHDQATTYMPPINGYGPPTQLTPPSGFGPAPGPAQLTPPNGFGPPPSGPAPGMSLTNGFAAPTQLTPPPQFEPARPRRPGPGHDRFAPVERLFGKYRPIRSHGGRRRRVPIMLIIVILIGIAGIAAGLKYVPGSPLSSSPAPSNAKAGPALLEPLPFRSAPVTADSVKTSGFYSWALVDLRTGQIAGPENMDQTSTGAQLVTAWLAADYLHRAEAAGQNPSQGQLSDLTAMVRDGDNSAADRTYQALGTTASIQRLVSTCHLGDTKAGSGWAATVMSARDTVQMGQCIADGTAAGSKWTPWLLLTMREVRNGGDYGIRKALPVDMQSDIAIINSSVQASDHTWDVNCLAIGDTWAMSVLQRFPSSGNDSADIAHTQQVCKDTASALRDNDVPLS
jgi:hypothetical protein